MSNCAIAFFDFVRFGITIAKSSGVVVKNGKVQELLGRAGFSASACTAENRPSFGLPF
ncbi:MAG: hypothetical protein FWE01_02040 [Firmicutes bacterium]|nr:hypothetical protein [Bacillota bacterium]